MNPEPRQVASVDPLDRLAPRERGVHDRVGAGLLASLIQDHLEFGERLMASGARNNQVGGVQALQEMPLANDKLKVPGNRFDSVPRPRLVVPVAAAQVSRLRHRSDPIWLSVAEVPSPLYHHPYTTIASWEPVKR